MVTKFAVADWRSIMRVCGSIAATCPPDRITCRYILLRFESGECVAYGSNASQITRLSVPCTTAFVPIGYELMILPMKVPARTKFVELDIDPDKKCFTISYIDEDNDIIDATPCEFFDGEHLDYEYFYKKATDSIEQYNHGEGRYVIAFNPKYLINALEGFKSCDHVIVNFANTNDPFMIRPYGDEKVHATAIVYPVRLLS